MIDRRISRAEGEHRPLRLRYQEALIRREMRRLTACSSTRSGEASEGDLAGQRLRARPSSGNGEVAGL
jgi:hypothetical protein